MPVSDLEKGLKEMMESMNNLGANVCDLAKNNPDHFYQMLKGNKSAAVSDALRGRADGETELIQTFQDIESGKLTVPIVYENPPSTPLKGYKAEVLRTKWDIWMDYRPHERRFNHFSPWMISIYKGDYDIFIKEVNSLNEEELKKKLEMRETLLCVGAVFHAIIGARSLVPGSEYRYNTERLHGKAGMEHMKILKKLLELGADVSNIHDVAGYTPLHHCLTSQGNAVTFEMAKLLLKKGVDPNARNRFGVPPLGICVMAGNLEFVELLIKHGADPNIKDNDGVNASRLAQHYPALARILKKGEKGILKEERELAKQNNLLKKCAHCKQSAENRCTGCFLEWYCGAACQKTDWTDHKTICKQRRKEFLPVKFMSLTTTGFNHQTGKTFMSVNGTGKTWKDGSSKKTKSTSFVVKLQVPLKGGVGQPMMVYNKERSVQGMLEEQGEAGVALGQVVRTKGYNKNKGYFYAILENENLLINPSILPPETW